MTQLSDLQYEKKTSFNAFLSKTFFTVFIGLCITTVVAFVANFIMQENFGLYAASALPVIIIQLGIAMFFSWKLMSMKKSTAWLCYIIYSVTMGITFATLPLIYEGSSIVFAVAMSAVLFGCMSFIGHTSRIDFTKFGGYMMMGLLMIIVITLLNTFFIHSSGLDMVMNYLGVILFLGIIAYDMQRLRQLYVTGMQDEEFGEKMMIYGAFQLYLDFMNMFIRILQIFGKERD